MATPVVLPLKAQAVKTKTNTLQQQQRLWGWIFISPWIIGFIIFQAAPIIFSFLFTLTNFNLTEPEKTQFIGLQNWARLFTDERNLTSMGVTIKFLLLAVPVGVIMPVAIAALLNMKSLKGKRIWTTLWYLPYMVPTVSSVFIWLNYLNGESGWLNRMLRSIGVANPPNYMQDQNWILYAFILIGTWGVGNAMLITLAGMNGVPTELYEAAEVDGASSLTRFIRITLPMISPVIFYNLVLTLIGLMQYFNIPYIATNGTGNPNNSAYFYLMNFYKTTFAGFDMGYGATQAWLLFLVCLALTIFLFATSRRWVYYSSGD
jgi:multiple sugar transport system permease protein